ncbi:MAG: sortase [Chloroflexota bacterium]
MKHNKSSDLQPIDSIWPKIWQVASYILIGGGLTLIGWGAWIFFAQQIESNQPPPARIVASSNDGSEEMPTRAPTPTRRPTKTPTPIPSPTATVEGEVRVERVTATPTVSPTPAPITATPTPAGPTPILDLGEGDGDVAPSLADNPLWLFDDEEEPEIIEVDTGPVNPERPSRIVAESIELDTSVIDVGWVQVVEDNTKTNVWQVAEFAAGWHRNSKAPGEGGNIVLSGHHNVKGQVFRYTVDLEVGDIISLYVGDTLYEYAVHDKFIIKDKGEPESVRRDNAKWIGPFNEERVTLVTCWPFNSNTHRVIVIAKPV